MLIKLENPGSKQPIGDALLPGYFTYKKELQTDYKVLHQIEKNLLRAMP